LGGLFVVGVSDGGSEDGVRVVEKWGEVMGEGLWVWREFLDVYSRIQTYIKVKEALQKMGRNKAMGPDEIPIEAWSFENARGAEWKIGAVDEALKENVLRVSREKTEYLQCNFNRNENKQNEEEEIHIGKHILEPKDSFRYLGSMIHKSRRIEDDSAPIRRVESLTVDGARRSGRPKLRREDRLKTDMKGLLLSEDMTSNRNTWKTSISLDEGFLVFPALRPFVPFLRFFPLSVSFFPLVVPLPSGSGVIVYILPPPYLVFARLGNVVVVVELWLRITGLNVPRSLPWWESLGRENVGFDLTKSNMCLSFVEDLTAKGLVLRVVDSHTGNHCEDDFTPLETIRRFLSIIGSRSILSSKGRPSSWRGGVPNRCSSSIGKTRGLLSFSKGIDDSRSSMSHLHPDTITKSLTSSLD
nr:retrovirus-related Pol polyprotein LINE-1 [Tanacetum cinerariifolium]